MSFESRFGAAAEAYSTFRPEYSSEIFDRILAAVPPDHRGLAFDLGAGTGRATRVLLEYFSQVIAIEPDPLMVEKLHAYAPRAVVHAVKAEDFDQDPETVDLVNIATALHWMDVPHVMELVTLWLRPGGLLAVYGSDFPRTPGPIHAIIREEFANHWDQFRNERLRRKDFPHSIIRAAPGLEIFEDSTFSQVVSMTPHEYAGFCRSTSYGSAYARSLVDEEAYWRDLESRFRRAWREDKFPVDSKFYLFLARKK
jgi:trans-aconitate methyltransferase